MQWFNKIEARTEDDGQSWIIAKSYRTTFEATLAQRMAEWDTLHVILYKVDETGENPEMMMDWYPLDAGG